MTDRLYHFISRPLPAAGPPPWVLHCLASDLARRRFLPDPGLFESSIVGWPGGWGLHFASAVEGVAVKSG